LRRAVEQLPDLLLVELGDVRFKSPEVFSLARVFGFRRLAASAVVAAASLASTGLSARAGAGAASDMSGSPGANNRDFIRRINVSAHGILVTHLSMTKPITH
jgi:hypothetical protein